MKEGWKCPQCGAIMGPAVGTCFYCRPNLETRPEQFAHRKDCQGAHIDTVCLGCELAEREDFCDLIDAADDACEQMEMHGMHDLSEYKNLKGIVQKHPRTKTANV
jgi:hypothetical protein